jgi:hypothetical protein
VPGHPFKGGWALSTGQLLHPDLKRFGLSTPIFFRPPMPGKAALDGKVESSFPSFGQFFQSYFGNASFNISNKQCSQMLEGMKKVIIVFFLTLTVLHQQQRQERRPRRPLPVLHPGIREDVLRSLIDSI